MVGGVYPCGVGVSWLGIGVLSSDDERCGNNG